jgi:hypothetical protein
VSPYASIHLSSKRYSSLSLVTLTLSDRPSPIIMRITTTYETRFLSPTAQLEFCRLLVAIPKHTHRQPFISVCKLSILPTYSVQAPLRSAVLGWSCQSRPARNTGSPYSKRIGTITCPLRSFHCLVLQTHERTTSSPGRRRSSLFYL